MTDVLEVRNLRVEYRRPRGPVIPAVCNISFVLQAGEVLGLLGESGCGKSSTALAILGLLPPNGSSQGSVRLEGRELIGLTEADWQKIRGIRIACVPQEPLMNLNPVLRAGTQVAEVVCAHESISRSAARDRARAALARTGLCPAVFDSYPHQLSGGERQRVLIAQAIVWNPPVILADEPAASLDPENRDAILKLLARAAAYSGAALLLITHDPEALERCANRIIVMHAGCIIEEGKPRDVLHSPMHPWTASLMRCATAGHASSRRLQVIEGPPPNAVAVPGCAFEPRCAERMSVCRESAPQLTAHGSRRVACFAHAGK